MMNNEMVESKLAGGLTVVFLLAAVALAPTAMAQLDTQLLQNPGFEDGTISEPLASVGSGGVWGTYTECPSGAPGTLGISSTAHTGSYSMELNPLGFASGEYGTGDTCDSGNEHDGMIVLYHTSWDPPAPEDLYAAGANQIVFSGYVNTENLVSPVTVGAMIVTYDSGWSTYEYYASPTELEAGVSGWRFFTVTAPVQSWLAHVNLRLYFRGTLAAGGDAGYVLIDDLDYRFIGAGEAERPVLGAIRWDGWNQWAYYEKCFDPPEWHYRLPFFGWITPDGKARVREDSQEVIDQEIVYAKAGGLNYWAFVWYHPDAWRPHSADMGRCLNFYLWSPYKSDINYCFILGGGVHLGPREQWPQTVAYFVERFLEPEYQKVLVNRPLVYLFDMDSTVSYLGSIDATRTAFDLLRTETVAAGLGEPYFVPMVWSAGQGASYIDQLHFDAISAYTAAWGGSSNTEYPYSSAAAMNVSWWEQCKATGKPLIPTVNTGWDYRPMKREEFPDRDLMADWFTEPTPQELADHLADAMDWIRANPSACPVNAVIVYAWNELSEGGWLVPTLSEGTARLDAIAGLLLGRVVKGEITSNPPDEFIQEGMTVTLTAPEGSNYKWRKNGHDIEEAIPLVTGTATRTLVLASVVDVDTGVYQCLYDDALKSPAVTKSFALRVLPERRLPLVGLLGCCVGVSLCAIVGVTLTLRRERTP